jgi:acetyl esterase
MLTAMSSKLDAQTQLVLEQISAKPFLDPSMTIGEMREAFERFHRTVELPRTETVVAEDRVIAGPGGDLRLRIYNPTGASSRIIPVVVYCHGGGMMMGSLDSHDSICRRIAQRADTILVAVDYRLAPEDHFPAAVEDVYAALL